MTSIRARLAAATGPDPQLELEILVEVGLVRRSQTPAGKWWLHHQVGGRWVGYHGHMDDWRDGEPPAYACYRVMSSLDAAVALIERALPGANCYGVQIDESGWMAWVSRNNVASGHWLKEAYAATAPLAILCAVFKALDAKAALAKPGPGAVG